MTRLLLFTTIVKALSIIGNSFSILGFITPVVMGTPASYTIEMDNQVDGYSRTFELFFSEPSQVNIIAGVPQSSFVVDTRLASVLVASEDC